MKGMKKNFFNSCSQEDQAKFLLCPKCILDKNCPIQKNSQIRRQKEVAQKKKKVA